MNKIRMRKSVGKILISDFSKFANSSKTIDTSPACKNAFNFKTSNGRLEKGLGIKFLEVRDEDKINTYQYKLDIDSIGEVNFNKVMYFKQFFKNSGNTAHRLLFHCSDRKLYMFELFSNTNGLTWVYDLEFDDIPAVLEYKKDDVDSILISSTNKLVVWTTDQIPYEITDVPTITSMCEYNDTLYCTIATDAEKLWYTQSLDPSNIGKDGQSNYIVLDAGIGGGCKVIQFNESVYVFCDYGIYRINTYAKDEPVVRLIYSCTGKINPDTIQVCGSHVLFVSTEGVYKFNGDTVLRVDELTNLLRNSNNNYATATYFHGCYYLAIKLDFDDFMAVGCEDLLSTGFKNNALIKFDLRDKTCEILRGVDIRNMLPLYAGAEEKIICTFNSLDRYRVGELAYNGMVFNSVFDRAYVTNYFTPENMKQIVIRKISIDASNYVQLYIRVDGKVHQFFVTADGVKIFNTYIPCKKFQIEIVSKNKDAYVNFVEIEYIK